MAVDIYFKLPSDPIYNPDGIDEDNEVEIFLQQLDMILSTKKGSVFGDPEFGLSLEQYLWSFSGGSGAIKQEIYQQITRYTDNIENIDFEIDVNFIKGEIWDSILVDVLVDGSKVAGYLMQR
jgi:hypothetical protein